MKNKIKIIQVTSFYAPHIGGMEMCAQEISERLAAQGYQVEVFTSNIFPVSVDSYHDRLPSTPNLKIHYLRSLEIAHTPIIFSLFFRLLFTPRPDCIHLHIGQSFTPEVVWLVAKLRHLKYVAHLHLDVKASGHFGFLLPIYKKLILKQVLQSADRVIVPTSDYVALVNRKYQLPKEKITMIPCGVDLGKFKPKPLNLRQPTKILFVGRLTAQKNVPLLIKSFKSSLSRVDANLSLHLVGEGEKKTQIIRLIEKEKLTDKVTLYGALRGQQLYDIFRASDIFILPSREESFGIVLIEALASGLAVIASDIPGIRNVIKNNYTGLLVNPKIADITRAIKKISTDSEFRSSLITHGLHDVKKYDWNKIVDSFQTVYSQV